jgi:hypothetical protein
MDIAYVDHQSGLSHFTCMKNNKVSVELNEMIHISSGAVILEVLQSNNRGEFLGAENEESFNTLEL